MSSRVLKKLTDGNGEKLEGSSSSSSGSSSLSSSSSSSDDDSGSESSSSSSSKEEKQPRSSGVAETNPKTQTQVNQRATRRKSERENLAPPATAETTTTTTKHSATAAATKLRGAPATTTTTSQTQQPTRLSRTSVISSEDEVQVPPPPNTPAKKANARPGGAAAQRRKSSTTTTATSAAATQRGGGKAPPGHVKQQPQSKTNAKTAAVATSVKDAHKDMSVFSSAATDDDDDDSDKAPAHKDQIKMAATSRLKHMPRATAPKSQPKRSIAPTPRVGGGGVPGGPARAPPKTSEDSESESASASGDDDDSSSSSESEASDSSHSFGSRHHPAAVKMIKGKRAPIKITQNSARSDSEDLALASATVSPDKNTTLRKLTTRSSLNTRRSNTKQPLKNGAGGTESDSDAMAAGAEERELDKRSLSKSPAKKPAGATGSSKCKVKKEAGASSHQPRAQTPPQHQSEKKCPIEGCDSSGHLSGNLDRHFLPEACPIYHNMSASECKERANERKLRNEQRHHNNKSSTASASNRRDSLDMKMPLPLPPAEQKEFLARIRESRACFRPIIAASSSAVVAAAGICGLNVAEKVKLEKDCTDEDREPCLSGLVPDYDLQLFREAQALASEKVEDELKDLPVGKGIKYITMGKYKMKVWYQSPYPDDAARLPKMYICEFCLRYQKSQTGIKRHAQKCVWRHPPGDEIYRKGKLQVWQVDGKRHKQYCQHLCLLAKFFLDHKTLYYDVEPFLFYIMTLADVDGCHTVGYFSKEKNSFYNVSCILTLPPYQRKGYGRLLIDFSYLLTRVEGKIGSPEKPLSDLGLISYRSYWKDVLLDYLCNRSGNTLSIKDVSQEMAIYSYDIVSTLQALGMMKYWKGKHIVLKKQDVLDEYEERVKRRGNFPKIDEHCLRWSPFVPTQATNSP